MIVNSNVNAANLIMVRTATVSDSTNSMKTDTGAGSFADVLQSSKKEIQPNITQSDTTNLSDDKRQNVTQKSSDNSNTTVKSTGEDNTVKQSEKTSDDTRVADQTPVDQTEDTVTEKEVETISAVVVDVVKMLMNQLNLSLDDVKNTLDAMGMDLKDLLSFRGIQDFFLQASQLQTSDLLTNADAGQMYQEFMQQWKEIFEAVGMTADEIAGIMESANIDFSLAKPDTGSLLNMEVVSVMQDGQTDSTDDVSQYAVQEPEVIVTRDNAPMEATKQNSEDGNSQPEEGATAEETQEMWNKDTVESTKDNRQFVNPILQNIQDALQNVETMQHPEGVSASRQIVEQVIEQVKIHMNQDTTSLQLQLYPEHLGRIQIHVVSKDGVMTARIAAETEQAKQAIENGLASLKETFEQQDLKVDAVEVMVSTTGFERGNEEHNTPEQEKASRGTGKLTFSDMEDDEAEEEAAEQERMRASGSSVSYTA
ncbi:MAG: flagellar hook-length control protein FliK [Lachnospiraceae bacterium]|nr:flagellar hook-length control protein FliK [Lachnospiraceae bacterium]